MSYDAVVFDNDGVLTTPTEKTVIREAVTTACRRVGIVDPAPDLVETLCGPTPAALGQVTRDHRVDPRVLWAARERELIAVQVLELRTGRKRVYDDTTVLAELPIPIGIVSNNQRETIRNILAHTTLSVDVWYGREPSFRGLERKKPNAYYLEQAIADLEAENPLFVGDSCVDLAAGAAADIDTAFLRRDHRQDYRLERTPTVELESLRALPSLLE